MQRSKNPLGKSRQFAQPEYISTDAPPLDFSFKNIHFLEEIKTIIPRQGQRKEPVMHFQELKKQDENKEKQQQQVVQKEQKKTQKKGADVVRLNVDNNITNLISTLVSNTNMKNTFGKNKEEKDQQKKRQVQISLICTTLILSYNKLRSIEGFGKVLDGVMTNFTSLQWVDLSHNYLEVIDCDFSDVPQLKMLYLHCNYVHDLNQLRKLGHLSQLKTLTIHGNPLTGVPDFRIFVIAILPELKKLDSVVISRKERDNSSVWVKSDKPFLMPKNFIRAPVEETEKSENQFN